MDQINNTDVYHDSTYISGMSKKVNRCPEWPKRLSMENEKFSIQEFKSLDNCSSRSLYLKYDFTEYLKEWEPIENDALISGTVQKIVYFAFGGKVDFLSLRN